MDLHPWKRWVSSFCEFGNLAETILAVYNVSEFVDEHPGGEEVLRTLAGTDATEAFEDAAHSEDAKEIMDGLMVGQLPSTVSRCART